MPLFNGSDRSHQRSPLASVMHHSDTLLALFLMCVVALFVLPMPTMVIDLLIAANLSISVVLVIVSMYVPSALSLSTFPSLLLFTTLFRLSLNIASAKLILLHAHAGQIIDAFGRLIVGNNVVVGGVVFLIIAIVQFIVIAKGSERVAEVAARFALDAMPGKQMSIDAEVRAGNLSNLQAQARRQRLEEESQLHGAMDGAMKFVKGDAIASLVIAAVNILGGIAVGTLMHDMDIGHAVQRYAILTVGDGMVSQIPSLLVSVAAGIVITRSGGASAAQPLAAQMLGQFADHPRALAIGALAISGFLLAPGFPLWAFGVWISLTAALAFAAKAHRQRGDTPAWISHEAAADDVDGAALSALTHPIALRLSDDLRGHIEMARFDQVMVETRRRVEAELGPVFPRMQVAFSHDLEPGQYRILVQDVAQAGGRLEPGRNLQWTPGASSLSVAMSQAGSSWTDAAFDGRTILSPEHVLALHTEEVARRHLPSLIGVQEVRQLTHWMQAQAPELAAEVARVVPSQRIAETLRRLLNDDIPVRNLKAIFESLLRWAPKEEDSIALTELVRVDLGAYITSLHVNARRQIHAVLFDTSLADNVANAIQRTPRGNYLALNPALKESVIVQLRALSEGAPRDAVLVVPTDIRRYVSAMISTAVPGLKVLAYQEVEDDVMLQPIGWITAQGAAA